MSFGSARCGSRLAKRWPILRDVCLEINTRLKRLRSLPLEQFRALAEEHSEELTIRNKKVRFTTYRTPVDADGTLVVVQAFFPTLLRPNFIPLGRSATFFSGRMTTEGLLLTADGQMLQAADELLWQFR